MSADKATFYNDPERKRTCKDSQRWLSVDRAGWFFVNWTQARVNGEEGASLEKNASIRSGYMKAFRVIS